MNKSDRDSINHLIALNQSFAIWRNPNELVFNIVIQNENTHLLTTSDLSELDKIDGFIIAPFDLKKNVAVIIQTDYQQLPIVDPLPINKLIKTVNDLDSYQKEEPLHKNSLDDTFSDFKKTFKSIKESLKEGIDKIVLAHESVYHRPDSFSPIEVFLKACKQHPTAYVHLSNTPITGTWIGASPELLLAKDKNSDEYHTMALAGTQLVSNHDDIEEWIKHPISLHWDAKNVQEQRIVSKFISNKLSDYNGIKSFNQMKPKTVRAGHLAHLQTRFNFKLPTNSSLGSLVMTLHPTPAVCGMPQILANKAITKAEIVDRGYYAGFVGYKSAKSCRFMVNLRCMNIEKNNIRLWAGAGILPSSKLEHEFREIELKKQIMKHLL